MINILSRVKSFLRYPRTVTQQVLQHKLTFKVHNLIEEDRVTGSNSEIEFTEEIISALTKTDRYFDIGSCIGFTAIAAAKNKACEVFAFEPDGELAGHLRHNIQLNQMQNLIQVNEWAVSDSNGTIEFFTSGANGASPSLAKTQNQERRITVKTYSIDSAIRKNLVRNPSVIKIDIEGAELMALKGMNETLRSSDAPKIIFIESHPNFLTHFGHTVEMMQQFLKENGYTEIYKKQRGEEYHHKFIKNS